MSASHALSVFAALTLGISTLIPAASTASSSADPVEILPLTTKTAQPTSVATAALEDVSLGSGQGLHPFPAWKVTARASSHEDPFDAAENAVLLTHPLEVSPFMVLGLTWDATTPLSSDTQLWVRVRENEQWSDWFFVHAEETSSRDGSGFQGATEPFLTGGADAIQVRVTGEESSLPANLQVALIPTNPSEEEVTLSEEDVTTVSAESTGIDAGSEHALTHLGEPTSTPHPLLNRYKPHTQSPTEHDADEDAANDLTDTPESDTAPSTTPSNAESSTNPSPTPGSPSIGGGTGGVGMSQSQGSSLARLHLPATASVTDLPVPVSSRQDWRADESKRDWDPEYHPASHVLVHHTVGTNNYSMSQSADIVRGIYHYHAVTLEWGDIGYHFLVDKWGRAFEGRYGTLASRPGQMVIGAHSGGFNSGTMGISMMGNYTAESPSTATIATVAKLAAWQLKRAGVDPEETAAFTPKGGNSKFRKGQTIRLPRISGHRDTFATACPGEAGQKALPSIRSLAHKEIYSPQAPLHTPPPTQPTSPRGNFEEIIPNTTKQTLTVKGWTFDHDTPTPIS
ncbi:N-acetylmuramoyl-L-alanine amidase, partial [Schaalia sp. Marseille-Q2122]|uniref:N-acetylmuramoyl-L-alanine amidase n=1 Tax=Schaalia sp. Marseille-Q2122 TaxID=2736604 RepID=UPI0015885523